jgi:xylulokinase
MRQDQIFEPSAATHATYDEIFDIYKDLHKSLGPIYKRLNPPRTHPS